MNGSTVVEDEHMVMQLARAGDRQAFAALVERYWDRLYRWLYHLAHDRHQAEDLAQEAFLKAFANFHTFRGGQGFQAWLFRIAHNTFVNQKRAQRKILQAFPEQLPDPEEGPEEAAMSREGLQILSRAVGRLPTEYRGAFLLRVEEGLSFREIADVLEITEETARWRVFKARQKLMDVLTPQLDLEQP